MSAVAAPLLEFVAGGAVLVVAGITLARSGDRIARETGLGGLVIGALLMAAATSLPELTTDIAAVVAGAPELAVADLLGSSMANMAILAILDLLGRRRVWPAVDVAHARSAALAIGLTAIALVGLLAPGGPRIGWVGLDTIVIGLTYGAMVAWIRRGGRPIGVPEPTAEADPAAPSGSLRGTALRFGAAAFAVLLAGPVTAVGARDLAEATGLGATFVGAAMLAVATSLPELVTSLAALRLGAFDLAVGNLFGSNAVNMAVLPVLDVVETRGPILQIAATPAAGVAGVGAILLMALALAAVVHGDETRIGRFEPDALLVLLTWIGLLVVVGVTG